MHRVLIHDENHIKTPFCSTSRVARLRDSSAFFCWCHSCFRNVGNSIVDSLTSLVDLHIFVHVPNIFQTFQVSGRNHLSKTQIVLTPSDFSNLRWPDVFPTIQWDRYMPLFPSPSKLELQKCDRTSKTRFASTNQHPFWLKLKKSSKKCHQTLTASHWRLHPHGSNLRADHHQKFLHTKFLVLAPKGRTTNALLLFLFFFLLCKWYFLPL